MKFKQFLLSEQQDYFAHKLGDLLTNVHELLIGGKQIGTRNLVKNTEGLVNQIRKILHSSWPNTYVKYLKRLQRCGVGLMRAIDEKGDLQDVLNSVRFEVEHLSQKLGKPINNLGASNGQTM